MWTNRIRKIRKAQGQRVRDIADTIGVREVTVSRWETGTRRPSLPNMHALAAALGVTLDELFPREDAA